MIADRLDPAAGVQPRRVDEPRPERRAVQAQPLRDMIADRLDPAACVQPRLEDELRRGRCRAWRRSHCET